MFCVELLHRANSKVHRDHCSQAQQVYLGVLITCGTIPVDKFPKRYLRTEGVSARGRAFLVVPGAVFTQGFMAFHTVVDARRFFIVYFTSSAETFLGYFNNMSQLCIERTLVYPPFMLSKTRNEFPT